MTYGECKHRVLELVFSYSVAGSEIPAAYNNQADYAGMIPGLLNQAQMDIATTVKRIYEAVPLAEMDSREVNGRIRYRLPEDCWLPLTGGLLRERPHGRPARFRQFRILGGKYIELRPGLGDALTLEYWRFPARITPQTPDETELDNTPDVHECLVYYAAAHLLAYDDAFRYTAFMNEYEKSKSRLREPVWLETGEIEDVYD